MVSELVQGNGNREEKQKNQDIKNSWPSNNFHTNYLWCDELLTSQFSIGGQLR